MSTSEPTVLQKNLKALMDAQGFSGRGLGAAAGTSEMAVGKILTGESRNPRSDTLMKLARALGVSVAELTGERDIPIAAFDRQQKPTVANDSIQRLHVRWEAAAGAWLEVDTHRDADEFADAPITSGGTAFKFLARVKGNSMDLEGMPDGSLAVCLEWEEVGRDPKDGDILLVQQTRDGGLMVETSIKMVKVFRDRYELHPRSSQPGYKVITIPKDAEPNDGREVKILGLVLGSYKEFVR
jgi:transcriptional regulator with XRE-family HTH domain